MYRITKEFSVAPSTFQYCVRTDCPMATECLRHSALSVAKCECLRMVNPSLASVSNEKECPYYLSNQPTQVAYGFCNLLAQMPQYLARQFREIALENYPRALYYHLRCGHIPLSPSDQEYIRKVVNQLYEGTDYPIPTKLFDRTTTHLLWSN